MIQKYWKEIILSLLALVVFVAMAQFSQLYQNDLQHMVEKAGVYAPLLYITISFLSIVVAPLGSGFLVPVAANAFGPFLAGVYSILGWFFGSVVAFYLARTYGHGAFEKWHMVQKIHTMEKHMHGSKLFFVLIGLRIGLPVDIMSYALGLFTHISYPLFISTTLLGITPFAFVFTYASVLPAWVQVVVSFASIASLFLAGYVLMRYTAVTNKNNL